MALLTNALPMDVRIFDTAFDMRRTLPDSVFPPGGYNDMGHPRTTAEARAALFEYDLLSLPDDLEVPVPAGMDGRRFTREGVDELRAVTGMFLTTRNALVLFHNCLVWTLRGALDDTGFRTAIERWSFHITADNEEAVRAGTLGEFLILEARWLMADLLTIVHFAGDEDAYEVVLDTAAPLREQMGAAVDEIANQTVLRDEATVAAEDIPKLLTGHGYVLTGLETLALDLKALHRQATQPEDEEDPQHGEG